MSRAKFVERSKPAPYFVPVADRRKRCTWDDPMTGKVRDALTKMARHPEESPENPDGRCGSSCTRRRQWPSRTNRKPDIASFCAGCGRGMCHIFLPHPLCDAHIRGEVEQYTFAVDYCPKCRKAMGVDVIDGRWAASPKAKDPRKAKANAARLNRASDRRLASKLRAVAA